jgi:hypothetical protein
MRRLASRLFDALSSLALSITVLAFLFLLVVLGTLEQTRTSLYEVQSRYFDSAFVLHDLGHGVKVPLPGVYLLLVVLFVNLVCGGLVRIRKGRSTVGVIVCHLGVAALFTGAAVEAESSQKGHAGVLEGQTVSEFTSFYDWEIAIAEPKPAGATVERVIPGDRFMRLSGDAAARFTSPDLPFDLVVDHVHANCVATPAPAVGVDGYALVAVERSKEAERDLAGARVAVVPKDGAPTTRGIVWAGERFPLAVVVAGRRFTIELAHRRWKLPFDIRLDQFRHEMHPGTGMAKAFESDVTKVGGGVEQKVKISMNQPLRQAGYTLFQSSFVDAPPGGRPESIFSVVRNPADDVPLWSCLVITAGLLLHFSQKLVRHVRTQSWRRS